VHSQTIKKQVKEDNSKINIGFSAGPNLTHVARRFYAYPLSARGYSTETKPAISYAGGLFFQYNFRTSSIHIEALYQRKGLYSMDPFSSKNNEGKLHVYFKRIIVPLYYRIRFGKLFMDMGIFAGYANRYIAVYKNPPDLNKSSYEVKKPFLKGLSAGLGYNFLNNKSYSLSVELRDEYELTNKDSFNRINLFSLNTINLLFGAAFNL
jgi:hypothetical protein